MKPMADSIYNNSKKNVLMITSGYPPLAAPASKRTACLAKFLPEFGWCPIVVHQDRGVEEKCYGIDPDFVENIPAEVLSLPVRTATHRRWSAPFMYDIFLRYFRPHAGPVSFMKNGRATLDHVFAEHRIDVIWATFPLSFTHGLASWAARRWRLPWVADCRDIIGQRPSTRFVDNAVIPLHIKYEDALLRDADAVVTVSEELGGILKKRHGVDAHIIPNGFDPDDLAGEEPPPLDRFRIVYTGHVAPGHTGFNPLLDAVGELDREGVINPGDIAIDFFGRGNESRLKEMFAGHQYERLVRIHDAVPWRECRAAQRHAAVLLQAAYAGRTGIITSKIFEYFAARRPILAVPRDGDCVDRMLEQTGAGFSCSTPAEIAPLLRGWYNEWKETGTVRCPGNREAILKFSRRRQAKDLARIMDRLLDD